MKKIISLIIYIFIVLSFVCSPLLAAPFCNELTEEENVSILYDKVFNHSFFDCRSAYEAGIGGFYQGVAVTPDNVPVTALITSAALAQRAYLGTSIFDEPATIGDFNDKFSESFGDKGIPLSDGKVYRLGELQTITFRGDVVEYAPISISLNDIANTNYRALYYVDRYEIRKDTLYIYDKYALADISSLDKGVVTVYSSSDKTEIVGYVAYDAETGTCAFEAALADYLRSLPNIAMEFYPANHGNYFSYDAHLSSFAEYETLLTEYKHTFHKNEDGNWIWYSSEPLDRDTSIPDTHDIGILSYVLLFSSAIAGVFVLISSKYKIS